MLYNPALRFVVRLPPAARLVVNVYHIDNAGLVPMRYSTHRRENRRRRARRIRVNEDVLLYFLYAL